MPRLNLTIPEQMDAALDELAKLTGRTKASYVIEAMSRALPHWRRDLAALRAGGEEPPPNGRSAASLGSGGIVVSAGAERDKLPQGMNREQRRKWLRARGNA